MTDLMTRLRAGDPAPALPDAPSLDALLGTRLGDAPDLEPPAPRRPRRRWVLAPALGAAVVALVLGLAAGRDTTDTLAEARQALGPEGGILHYVLRRPGAGPGGRRAEVWTAADPLRSRMQLGEGDAVYRDQYADGVMKAILPGDDHVTVNRMTPEFQRFYEHDDPSPTGLGADPLDGVRRMLAEGRLHDDGEADLDGRRVRRLTGTEPGGPAPGGATRPTVDREYYVDAETFAPVRLIDRWHQGRGTAQTDFEVYERLPLTPENEALLTLPGIEGMREVDPNR